MRIKSLIGVNVDKTTTALSFDDGQGLAINLQPDGKSLKRPSVGFVRHSSLPGGIRAVRTFCVEGKVYAQCSDNLLYAFEKGAWAPLCNTVFNAPVDVISIIYGGEKRLLIFSAEKAVVKGLGEEEVNLPAYDVYAYTAGMLFMAKGNVLRFSKPFNFTDFTVDLELGGYLETDDGLGEIVGLKGESDGVTLVCKKGIAKLTTIGERTAYSFKKYSLPYIDVVPNTVAVTPDAVCFISENEFCSFKKGALTKEKLPFKRSDIIITDSAVSARGRYLLPVRLKGVDADYVYCRGGFVGECSHSGFLVDGKAALSVDGGYAADIMTNSVYRFALGGEGIALPVSTAYYKSRVTSFSTHGVKFITDIFVDCEAGFTLKVNGAFGTVAFGVSAGHSHVKCNLQSPDFTFEVVGNGQTEINALSVKYRT